ncbi:MAG TPA: histidine phosphatase family protein [Burkholderiaceae bacterium]|nr:histidine phosphatase family protein [Burkholderiaceae bacterium]
MKTLILVRHAEASSGHPAWPDRDRPLTERGLRDVAAMGQRLAQRGAKPDLLLASPATRALTTAEHLAEALGIPRKDIVVNDRLYAAPASALLAVIGELGDAPQRLMLVAHNPGLSDLAQRYAPEIVHLPTCAVAEFTFAAAAWGDIGEAKPTQVVFDFPKKG